MSSKIKELVPKLEETTRDRDMMVDMVQRTGASPQQYQQSLQYLSLVNSNSRADREKALEIMQAEISVLARSLGKPVPGVNFLEGHEDLIQAVGRGQISPEYATEVAAARERSKLERKGSEQRMLQNHQAQNDQQALTQGRSELDALEATLKADPHYAAKRVILVETLKPVFEQIHPSQWAATFKRAYDKLPAPVAPSPRPVGVTPGSPAANGGGNTPLRASNPAGGARPAPKNMAEAIGLGIAEGSR
jgi:hypothetical protein